MILKSNHFDESLFNNSLFDVQKMAVMNNTLCCLGVLEEYTDTHLSPLSMWIDGQKHGLANPLFTLLKVNSVFLNPKYIHPMEHEQIYDIDVDIFSRKTIYEIENTKITISSERFVDQVHQIIYSKYEFETDKPISIDLYQGINDKFDGIEVLDENKINDFKEIALVGGKKEENIVLKYTKDFRHKARPANDKLIDHYIILTEANRTYTVYKYIGIGHGIDKLNGKISQAYDRVKENHSKHQKKNLEDYRLTIIANEEAQTKVDFARRYLLKYPNHFSNSHVNPLSIYFMVYANIHHQPKRAKALLKSEIKRLKEAKIIAKDHGYQGAMYVSNPQKFIEGSQHILNGAMIIYALDFYVDYTKDDTILKRGGLNLMVEIAHFYSTYARYIDSNNHYAFLNIANIDGSIEHINYHTLTHVLVRYALSTTKKYIRRYKHKVPAKTLKLITEVNSKIYIPQPNTNDLLLPYKDFLQDIENEQLVVSGKKIDLTADQLLVFMLFSNKYSEKVVVNNLDYFRRNLVYNLSNQWIQAIVPRAEITNLSIKQFNKVTSLSKKSLLVGENGVDIGVCALVYYMMVYGYAGLRKEQEYFSVDTNIPNDIRRLEFWIGFQNHIADIKIKRNSARLEWRMEV